MSMCKAKANYARRSSCGFNQLQRSVAKHNGRFVP